MVGVCVLRLLERVEWTPLVSVAVALIGARAHTHTHTHSHLRRWRHFHFFLPRRLSFKDITVPRALEEQHDSQWLGREREGEEQKGRKGGRQKNRGRDRGKTGAGY